MPFAYRVSEFAPCLSVALRCSRTALTTGAQEPPRTLQAKYKDLEAQNEQLRAALQQADLDRARQQAELETLTRHLLSGAGSIAEAAALSVRHDHTASPAPCPRTGMSEPN